VTTSEFSVLVLAGERNPGADPLARRAGTASKVLVPIAGTPVIDRVIDAVESAGPWRAAVLAGPPRTILTGHPFLNQRLTTGTWRWLEPAASPASTVVGMLTTAAPPPALITTADHAFLSPTIIRHFLTAAATSGADVSIGFARLAEVKQRFPDSHRTGWRFRDDAYCSCNLFAFMTPRAVQLARLWQRFESDRKRPWRIIAALGPRLLWRHWLGRLTLAQALTELGRQADCHIAPTVLPFPQAAVDVDTIADWQLANREWAAIAASDGR
jgi:GTP:adenosylcobinamide-phosphate guanylyltransferase